MNKNTEYKTNATVRMLQTASLKILPALEDLLPIDGHVLKNIMDDMKEQGFDPAFPVVVWKERNVIVDGHTRLQAAEELEIKEVPVVKKSFKDEDEAQLYALHAQCHRRNLTDGEIRRLVELYDKIMKKRQGQRTDLASNEAKSGKSSEEIAEKMGISSSKVEKSRTITAHADDETKKQLDEGKISMHKAYTETKEKEGKKKKESKDSVEKSAPTLDDQIKAATVMMCGLLKRLQEILPVIKDATDPSDFLKYLGELRELIDNILTEGEALAEPHNEPCMTAAA